MAKICMIKNILALLRTYFEDAYGKQKLANTSKIIVFK
jgi:hypothetical protein